VCIAKTLPGWQLNPREHLSCCPIFGVHFSSIAAVARRYQLNANLVQKWRKAARDNGGPLTPSPEFIPIPLAMSAPADVDVRVTLIIGELTIQWPLSYINQALPWLKALQS